MSAVQLLRGHQDSPICMAFNAANGTLASGAEVGAWAVFVQQAACHYQLSRSCCSQLPPP